MKSANSPVKTPPRPSPSPPAARQAKPLSALAAARASILFDEVARHGRVRLDVVRQQMGWRGMTRAQVERAVSDLVADSRLAVTTEWGQIVLRLVTANVTEGNGR